MAQSFHMVSTDKTTCLTLNPITRMKKSILVLGLSVFTMASYAASELVNNASIVSVITEGDKKVEIEATKLPESVAKAIAEANKDAKISKAFQLVDATNKITGYEVIVLGADQKEQTLKFDATGTWVK